MTYGSLVAGWLVERLTGYELLHISNRGFIAFSSVGTVCDGKERDDTGDNSTSGNSASKSAKANQRLGRDATHDNECESVLMKFCEMSARQLAAVDRDQTLIVIPIAATEQHGPHMPTGTDTFLCTAVAEAVETRLSEQILLTPTVWLGASAHHLRLGSTIDSRLDTYVATLDDIARSLLNDGHRRLLFLNGHGGNIDPMRMAVRQLQPSYPSALLAAGSYWAVADEFIQQSLDGDHKYVGHACEFETSMMLHVRPELVDTQQLVDAGQLIPDQKDGVFLSRDMRQRTHEGFTGRPDLATPEKGELLFAGIVDRLVTTVEKLLSEPLGTEYQDFVR